MKISGKQPLLLNSPQLTQEFENLVSFVKSGLLDHRPERRNLCRSRSSDRTARHAALALWGMSAAWL